MKKFVLIASLLGVVPAAHSLVLSDVAWNDSAANALNLDGSFSTGSQANIIGSNVGWSWVSVNSVVDSTYDFFTFTNNTDGSSWWFDVDSGVDSEIGLWDSNGLLVWGDTDDGCIDQDSSAINCSSQGADDDNGLLEERGATLSAGQYTFAISRYNSFFSNDYVNTGSINDNFSFNISTNAAIDVAEPESLALFALGLVGIAGWQNRKKKLNLK
jgi:hypothetical protein